MGELIAAASAAMDDPGAAFSEHARAVLGQWDAASRALATASEPGEWQRLYAMVHDLRASSALVRWQGFSAICASLERAIQERDLQHPKMLEVARLHHQALLLLVAGQATGRAAWQGLTSGLAEAVRCLPRAGEPAKITAIPFR